MTVPRLFADWLKTCKGSTLLMAVFVGHLVSSCMGPSPELPPEVDGVPGERNPHVGPSPHDHIFCWLEVFASSFGTNYTGHAHCIGVENMLGEQVCVGLLCVDSSADVPAGNEYELRRHGKSDGGGVWPSAYEICRLLDGGVAPDTGASCAPIGCEDGGIEPENCWHLRVCTHNDGGATYCADFTPREGWQTVPDGGLDPYE